jgi:hypothetical protein
MPAHWSLTARSAGPGRCQLPSKTRLSPETRPDRCGEPLHTLTLQWNNALLVEVNALVTLHTQTSRLRRT